MILRIMVVVWAFFAGLNLLLATLDGRFDHPDYAQASYEVGMAIVYLIFTIVTAWAAMKKEEENAK